MSFAIGIPTLNRHDLLWPTLEKYVQDFPDFDIYIVDNGRTNLKFDNPYVHIITPEKNLGVAASWNLLIDTIFENHDYALILNDDIYCGFNSETVFDAIMVHPDMFVRSSASWSVFLMSKFVFNTVGRFDETFYPAYYEDSDYIRRMYLLSIPQIIDDSLYPQIFRISGTYEKAPDLVNRAMQENRERYIRKWGNVPLLETFTTPYNK
jgi:GT2 family glycosyltransferase